MAAPNNAVVSVRVWPLQDGKLEVAFGDALYSARNGEWVGAPPPAKRARAAKAAVTAAFPKAHKKAS